jgi:hypothetical protein
MGVILNKSTTGGTIKFLALSPREALQIPFGFSDWTKIRIGMMLGYTDLTSANANMDGFGSASIVATTERDRLFYGIKKQGPTFPRENNDVFVGFKTYGANTYVDFPITFFDHRNFHGSETHLGVHHPNGSKEGKHFEVALNAGWPLVQPSAQNDETSLFAGFPVVYLEIVNKGQSNQKIIVRYGVSDQQTDSSASNLRQRIINTSLTVDAGTLAFNQSGTPYELPDSFFIYNPIPTIRTRVFGLTVIKEE